MRGQDGPLPAALCSKEWKQPMALTSIPLNLIEDAREAFVDDSSLWLLKLGLALATVIELMQTAVQKWERLLYATGSALNHAKCFWYGIDWTFNANEGCKMNAMPLDEFEIKLMAGDDLTTFQTIERIPTMKGI